MVGVVEVVGSSGVWGGRSGWLVRAVRWAGGDGLLRSFNDFLADLLWLGLLLQEGCHTITKSHHIYHQMPYKKYFQKWQI